MSERFKRRLFMFLDGTWNEDQNSPTNIVRMRECLKFGVDAALAKGDPTRRVSGSIVRSDDGTEHEYIVYYDRGVGTGVLLDRWKGGIFGSGLDVNVRQGYRFLSENYADGDEIYVFGFSRGAFTARSIVGYITAAGLLKPQYCTTDLENKAWKHYRTSPGNRYCGEWQTLQEYMFDHKTFTVKCLGVFDTVGALGVPLDVFHRFNAEKYAFHDTELNGIVEISLHAVAIDERRPSFPAALWHRPKFKRFPKSKIEQVWFPGAHSDVGGGYENWMSDGDARCGRQDIAFEWMISRLRAHVKNLPLPDFDGQGRPEMRIDPQAARAGIIHRPWAGLDRVRFPAVRKINQIAPLKRKRERVVGDIAHEEPIYEAVHISALELLTKAKVRFEGSRPSSYRPSNLVAAIPAIVGSYRTSNAAAWPTWQPFARMRSDGDGDERQLLVVDWDGERIDPSHPDHEARRAALSALLATMPGPTRLGLKAQTTPVLGRKPSRQSPADVSASQSTTASSA